MPKVLSDGIYHHVLSSCYLADYTIHSWRRNYLHTYQFPGERRYRA